uniref:Uncharacterized protein n=1 Tax=Globodera pallida TaxID=36090 RepID=A0A183CA81_GLOPA
MTKDDKPLSCSQQARLGPRLPTNSRNPQHMAGEGQQQQSAAVPMEVDQQQSNNDSPVQGLLCVCWHSSDACD